MSTICPKTIEFLWMLDHKMSPEQEKSIDTHMTDCPKCRERLSIVRDYYNGKTGTIIQPDDSSCLSEIVAVKTIRLENEIGAEKGIEEHLKNCKACTKKVAELYTNPIRQDEIMQKERARRQVELGELAANPTSTIYGDKMSKIEWWLEGEVEFWGKKFSRARIAISAGILVFISIWTIFFITSFWDDTQKQNGNQPVVVDKDKPQVKDEVDLGGSQSKKDDKKYRRRGIDLFVYRGNLIVEHNRKRRPVKSGIVEIFSEDKIIVSPTHKAFVSLPGCEMFLFGPCEMRLYKQQGSNIFDLAKGTVVLQSYSKKFPTHLAFSYRNLPYEVSSPLGQVMVRFNQEERQVYALKNKAVLDHKSKLAKVDIPQGLHREIRQDGLVTNNLESSTYPPEYFQVYSRQKVIFSEDFSKGSKFPRKVGRGEFTIHREKKQSFLNVSCEHPSGITLESKKFPVYANYMARLRWKYRLSGSPSKPVFALVGQKQNDRKFFEYTQLKATERWTEVNKLFFLPPYLKTTSPMYLRLEFLGAAKVDLTDIELSIYTQPQKQVLHLDMSDEKSLQKFSIQSGTFRLQRSGLQAKSTLKEGSMVTPVLESGYRRFEVVAKRNVPFGVLVAYKGMDDHYRLSISPDRNQYKLEKFKDGFQENMASGTHVQTRPIHLKIIQNGNFYAFYINGQFLLEFTDETKPAKSQMGILIFPETKQVFEKVSIHHN